MTSTVKREPKMEACTPTCNAATPLVATSTAAGNTNFAIVKAEESVSANIASNPDLASHFECPVCFDYVLPPIIQCNSGHLVCSQCRAKLTCCPSCRGPLGSIRNLAMERVAEDVLFPCKFRTNGCPQAFRFNKKKEHEDLCEFRPYMCPCPGAQCKWQGNLDGVLQHLFQAHKTITTLQGEDIVFLATDVNLRGAVDWVMMQGCYNCNFLLALEKQEKTAPDHPDLPPVAMFYAVVQIIGTRQQAEHFVYKLELSNSASSRRLLWESVPRSIQDGLASAITQHDCLTFDAGTAALFADNGGNLAINVTVMQRTPSTQG
ncbi:E3 ubiquitin-protein ligase Siah1-like [Sycon ciliatum]|uniref:E3 ubiquitin-protein ligase Siah1-like n=1 Tax=Sycon ciliatum TaxID=27933 RepID=UPI0020A9C5E6|eukprot:scpid61869/ scgid29991/ E3 ubiquitin-protein ligase Siah1; Seven in absentia homolog 1